MCSTLVGTSNVLPKTSEDALVFGARSLQPGCTVKERIWTSCSGSSEGFQDQGPRYSDGSCDTFTGGPSHELELPIMRWCMPAVLGVGYLSCGLLDVVTAKR